MSIEQQPSQKVEKAVRGLVRPWAKSGLELPRISVVELSRLTNLPPVTVLNTIADGGIILNGSVAPQQAVIDGEVRNIREAQPGPFYQKTAAGIWSEGQRYQRRFQFQPINTKGKPTRKRIEARVVEEQTRRAKIAFVPYENPDKRATRENKAKDLELRWLKKLDQDPTSDPEKRFIQLVSREAQFQTQNLAGIKRNLEKAQSENTPFRFGCFVCLVNEWIVVNGIPVYKVSTDPNLLSRLEQDSFAERSNQIFEALNKTGIPYEWTFLIADTDAWELFGDWSQDLEADRVAIKAFELRVRARLCSRFPEFVNTELWSKIQEQYQDEYDENFCAVLDGRISVPNIEVVLAERFEYYKKYYTEYFAKKGWVVDKKIIEMLATLPPKRNVPLYAAQGPLAKKRFDLLVIGDRDPLRCGRNQSVLAKDLPIWYPYQGG